MTGNSLSLATMEPFPGLDATQDADAATDRALAATRRRTRTRRQMVLASPPSGADVTAAFRAAASTAPATRPSRRPVAPLSVLVASAAPGACLHC